MAITRYSPGKANRVNTLDQMINLRCMVVSCIYINTCFLQHGS